MTPDAVNRPSHVAGGAAPLGGRRADVIGFAWGLAEATLFFIVPDVWLSLIGARSVRAGLRVCAWTLAGALVGGTMMYAAGAAAPSGTRAMLADVPAISASMIATVDRSLQSQGLTAVLVGPARGRPYKIYAAEWGASGGALLPFLGVSVPARLIRFLLSIAAAAAIARILAPWTHRRIGRERAVLLAIWTVFYALYFRAVGR